MKTVPSISEQTHQYFLQESADLLQIIDSELQTLRTNFSLQKVHSLMRATHTLKGAAASVGLDNLVQATHTLEDIFNALCYDDTVVSQTVERLLFEGYDCLQQLVSAQQPAQAKKVNTALQNRMAAIVTLDRLAIVTTQLQDLLGDRFGQQGHIPASAELGFDLAQSIFEMGVAQRLATLATALTAAKLNHLPSQSVLDAPDLDSLRDLLTTQAEIFIDLAESLDLPGFGEIATLTLKAIAQQPNRVIEIASVALENLKAAQSQVLDGDRTSGGSPSAALKQFYNSTHPLPQKVPATRSAISNQAPAAINNDGAIFANSPGSTRQQAETVQPNWFKRQWQALTQPIGDTSLDVDDKVTDRAIGGVTDRAIDEVANRAIALHTDDSDDDLEISDNILSNLDKMKWGNLTIHESNSPAEKTSPIPPFQPNLLCSALPKPLPAHAASSVPSGREPEAKQQNTATIRMKVEHLDQLSQAMGELLSQQNRQALYNDQLAALAKKLLARISQQQQQLNQQKDQPLAYQSAAIPSASVLNKNTFDVLELDCYSDVQRLAQSVLEETVQQSESAEAIELFVRQSGQALEKQKRVLSNTREILLSVRMVPLETVFQRFAAAVARLQAQHHKQVDLELKGGEVLVDRVIADKLYEPLLHLVRNAFDHGIEIPDSRLANQKTATGKITIEGRHQGRNLIVRVVDDGRGIDLDQVRRKAVETQRLTTMRAAALTPEQTIDLLFETGFSTRQVADELSGRGVGLEAVREQMRSLKGWVTVNSEVGSGSDFALNIPASLTIANLLLCQVKGRVYALIADAVEHILIPTEGQVRVWEGGKMLTWQAKEEEHLIPICELAKVLNEAAPMPSDHAIHPKLAPMPVVLLRGQNSLVGIEVDRLLGEQELVISPLGNTVVPPAYLYGSSLLPDGQLTLVLDGATLAKKVSAQRHQKDFSLITTPNDGAQKTARNRPIFLKKLILTVDDSITVRNAIAEVLQRANYQVIQAQDGAEALQQLSRYPEVEAILCDIEMPGMNGFEFLKARQRSPRIASIPTIMLTSRGGTKHRLLSQELGATGYLTKPYLNPHLLKTVSAALDCKVYQPLSVVGESYE